MDLSNLEGADAGEEDLEQQFHYHLRGLHTVPPNFTRKAKHILTNRYKQEIGFSNWGHWERRGRPRLSRTLPGPISHPLFP